MSKFRIFLTTVLVSSLLVTPVITAHAESRTFQQRSIFDDDGNPANVDALYDLEEVEIGLYDTDPDLVYFWLHFKYPITQSMFVHSSIKTPWALITLWRSKPVTVGGDSGDFRISTNSSTQYSLDNTSIAANAFGNTLSGQTRNSLTSCNPKTWSKINSGVKWIGFSISRKCAKIPDQFWINGYVDPNSSNNGSSSSGTVYDWDYVPSSPLFVDLTLKNTVSPTATPTPAPTPAPTIVKVVQQYQTIVIDSNFPPAKLSEGSVQFDAYATSGLNVILQSLTPDVCQIPYDEDSYWDTKYVELIGVGTCTLELSQPGDTEWYPAFSLTRSFYVAGTPKPAPTKSATKKPVPKATPSKAPVISGSASSTKKPSTAGIQGAVTNKIGGSATSKSKSIICVKGKLTKTVTAINPICPTGYTIKK